MVQRPVIELETASQQAPRGAQVVLVQAVLGPCHWPPAERHWARVRMTQEAPMAPVAGRQQAPRGAQVSGVQVVFGPCHEPPLLRHCCLVRMEHAATVGEFGPAQHAPTGGGGQTAVSHEEPSPR